MTVLTDLIQHWIDRKGMSWREVSFRLDLHETAIDRWRRGAPPPSKHIPALARMFGVSVAEFLAAAKKIKKYNRRPAA